MPTTAGGQSSLHRPMDADRLVQAGQGEGTRHRRGDRREPQFATVRRQSLIDADKASDSRRVTEVEGGAVDDDQRSLPVGLVQETVGGLVQLDDAVEVEFPRTTSTDAGAVDRTSIENTLHSLQLGFPRPHRKDLVPHHGNPAPGQATGPRDPCRRHGGAGLFTQAHPPDRAPPRNPSPSPQVLHLSPPGHEAASHSGGRRRDGRPLTCPLVRFGARRRPASRSGGRCGPEP